MDLFYRKASFEWTGGLRAQGGQAGIMGRAGGGRKGLATQRSRAYGLIPVDRDKDRPQQLSPWKNFSLSKAFFFSKCPIAAALMSSRRKAIERS